METTEEIITHIKSFIEGLTGLIIRETNNEEIIQVQLGIIDPTVVGFLKLKHPDYSEENMRLSIYISLLGEVQRGLKTPGNFFAWTRLTEEG